MIKAVLFDLDGTLADTAPDLAYALNLMRRARGMSDVPLTATRPVTSMGARGMLKAGFGVSPDSAEYEPMRLEFLANYDANLCRDTRLFQGMDELLAGLEARGLRWGVVTNKAERFAKPLIEQLGLQSRAACIIGGDTTPHLKPHPASLFAACERLGLPPADCLYVGDDERDILAARAAGMGAVAAAYGYLNGHDPYAWKADAVIAAPPDLLARL
jgi:phosphoglycolate phosphatase